MSKIWEYFIREERTAICNACNKQLSLGHALKKKQTTNSIRKHLEKIHPELWTIFIDSSSVVKVDTKPPKLKKIGRKIINFKVKKEKTTLTEKEESENELFWHNDHPLALHTDKLIMDFIIAEMLPFSIVESPVFQKLHFGDPSVQSKYQMKSEEYFRQKLMPETYERILIKVIAVLDKAEWISITSNIMKHTYNSTTALLTTTAYVIDGSKRLKVILSSKVLEDTTSSIAEHLDATIKNFKIDGKVHLIIANNILDKAFKMHMKNVESFGCVSFTIQKILNNCIFTDEKCNRLIEKCRKCVEHFMISEQACHYLSQYQEMCNVPNHDLKGDIAMAWESTFLMLERLLEQKNALILYSEAHCSMAIPNDNEWKLMDKLMTLLQPFYQATLELALDTACISVIIPLIHLLRSILESLCKESDEIEYLKKTLLKHFDKCFENIMTNELMIATFLDPRFKTKYFSDGQVDFCKSKINSILESYNHDEFLGEDGAYKVDPLLSTTVDTKQNNMLWDRHDSSIIAEELSTIQPQSYINEINNYLLQRILPRDTNIYHYWHLSPFQNLKFLARQFLSAPPSSLSNEKRLITGMNSNFGEPSSFVGENADKLRFLAFNIKTFNFEY